MERRPVTGYTESGDPATEQALSEAMTQIVDEIVGHLHPVSLILIGSFGRGEVTAAVNDGKLRCLSDVDIILITNRYVSKGILDRLSSELSRKTGLEVGIANGSPEMRLHMAMYKLFHKAWRPSIDDYDMKYGSRVLHGKDYLAEMPDFNPQDIPVWEGLRLIFNRMIEALAYFSGDVTNVYLSEEEEQRLLSATSKIILACQDALLLSVGKYHHSYRVRNGMFQQLLPVHFSQLNNELPRFSSLAVAATDHKLRPDRAYSGDVITFWFEAKETCDGVFRYIMEKQMNITFGSYAEFQQKYLRHPSTVKEYYRGLMALPLYQNLRSAVKMAFLFHRLPPLTIIATRRPWAQLIYSTIPLLYFATARDGSIDESYLDRCRQSLAFNQLNARDRELSLEFDYLKQEVFNLREAICY